jgi:probable addiction module antidote protein
MFMAAKRKMKSVRAVDIESTLLNGLKDPEVAASYVSECLSEKGKNRSKLLLAALMNVAQAQGISKISKGSETKRRMIYKVLAEDSNPSVSTLESILENMGLMLDVRPLKKAVND